MKTLDALKSLAVKITTAENTAAVDGNTIDEVIDYIDNNLAISASGLVLTDSNDVVYDITVSTSGEIVATARS